MDLAASSSSAPINANPATEKARERQRRKIIESIMGLKSEDQVEFLISRMAENEVANAEQKKEMEQTKREVNKMNAKLDSAQKLLSKTEVAKSKLEQLCRELNKAQREEKEHNQLRLKQMQTAHADTVESFKKSLADIQISVDAKHEHSKRVADVEKLSDNLNQMAADYETRLNELKKLYEDREHELHQMASDKDNELTKMRIQIQEMQKRVHDVFSENVELKKELLDNEGRLKKSIESEIALRNVLDDYSRKYAQLTESFTNSNSTFDNFKEQIAKMNGNMIKLQKEVHKWKGKAEEAEKTVALKDRQLVQLQGLCRRLNKEGQQQQPVGNDEDSCNNHEQEKQQPTNNGDGPCGAENLEKLQIDESANDGNANGTHSEEENKQQIAGETQAQ